jgi:hypothetical protein
MQRLSLLRVLKRHGITPAAFRSGPSPRAAAAPRTGADAGAR